MLQGYRIAALLWLLSLPLLAACATSGLRDLESPYVTLSNVSPANSMSIFEQRYDVALRVQNPNNVDLPVDGFNYTLILNDREFARGVSRDNVVIPALGEQVIHVTVTNSLLDWVKQIDRLNNNPTLKPSYKVQGTLFLQGLGAQRLPFSQAGTFMPGE